MSNQPRIEILNTGSELLLGTTLNTHGGWLGQTLQPLAISESLARNTDVLIITGGLGPTSDDLTREATAAALNLELIEDEHALRTIEAFFAARNRPMAAANAKQAEAPVGADILPNPNGTAPGLYLPPRLGKGTALFLRTQIHRSRRKRLPR